MTKVEKAAAAPVRHSGFACRAVARRRRVIDSSFVIRLPCCRTAKAGHSSFRAADAFTLIELLVVIAIIIVLAGLVLSTVGYVQKKGARSRAETEIAAMSAACESYKADNGIYPTSPETDALNARATGDPMAYETASLYLYNALFGATNGSRTPNSGARSYFVFKPNMLSPADQNQNVLYIRDPFGNSYGYSTIQATGNTAAGYNPTFDLWSTAGLTATPDGTGTDATTQQWIKNW